MRRLALTGVLLGSLALSLPATAAASTLPAGNHARVGARLPDSGHGHGHSSSTFGWTSSNWSGYALSGSKGSYSQITGTWTVPTVVRTKGSTYSSSWIGIDGFNNSSLIQTGTEQDYTAGHAQYYAWWEILPAAETQITTMTVSPGDSMTASIVNDGGGSWTITLKDVTQSESFTTTQSYSGPASSAEWIEEAPTIGGHIATLADYGQTTFSSLTVNGGNPGLVSQDGGVMIQRHKQVSTPSVPSKQTNAFAVAYGSTSPSAP